MTIHPLLFLKIRDAVAVEQLQDVCQQNVGILIDAGFTKPVCRLTLTDKEELIQMVALQNTIILCSQELQQLCEGLSALGVANLIRKYPALLKPFFTIQENQQITTGKFY